MLLSPNDEKPLRAREPALAAGQLPVWRSPRMAAHAVLLPCAPLCPAAWLAAEYWNSTWSFRMPCARQRLWSSTMSHSPCLHRPAPVAAAPDRVEDVDADARAVQGVVVLPIQRQVRVVQAVQVPGRVLLHMHQRRLLHLHLLVRVQGLHLGVLAQRTLLLRVQLRSRPAQLV